MRGLNSFVFDQVNISETNGETIDGNWLKSIINLHFNKSEIDELDYLVDYGNKFLENLDYKSNSKTKKIGVTDATKRKYQTIVNKLIAFDNHKNKRLK